MNEKNEISTQLYHTYKTQIKAKLFQNIEDEKQSVFLSMWMHAQNIYFHYGIYVCRVIN